MRLLPNSDGKYPYTHTYYPGCEIHGKGDCEATSYFDEEQQMGGICFECLECKQEKRLRQIIREELSKILREDPGIQSYMTRLVRDKKDEDTS